jgi:hypothetical protein
LLETMLRLETTIYTDFSNAEINVTRFQEWWLWSRAEIDV